MNNVLHQKYYSPQHQKFVHNTSTIIPRLTSMGFHTELDTLHV